MLEISLSIRQSWLLVRLLAVALACRDRPKNEERGEVVVILLVLDRKVDFEFETLVQRRRSPMSERAAALRVSEL